MSTPTIDTETDRRARQRARSFKHVKIMYDDDKAVFDAVLRNVSAYGATIAVSLSEKLPDRFDVHIVNDNFTVPCEVKWRGADCIGVAF